MRVRIIAHIPDAVANAEYVEDAIRELLRNTSAPEVERMLDQSTSGWKAPPYFSSRVFKRGSSMVAFIHADGPNADKYNMLDAGAPPHVIYPRRRGFLRFYTGYRPATRPGSLSSRPASRFGSQVAALYVNHPGFEPRNFYETGALEYEPTFYKDVEDLVSRTVMI